MSAITFCGASVIGFSSALAWSTSGSKSSLTVNVVEDEKNGDFFVPPPNGTPVYFHYGAFQFYGLLQSWTKRNSTAGLNLYTLQCEDPRDILNGTTVIINNYMGSTYNIANILNVYGWWENTYGYGASEVNEDGIPWNRVLTAVQGLTNSTQGNMGGPLQFRGVSYAVDLSELPVPPSFYRVGGSATNVGLMELIGQVCSDGGCEFFVELDWNPSAVIPTIKIKTVSRYAQPPLGTIEYITNSNWGGTVVSSDNGLETRNEATTSFLVGGPVQTLYQTFNLLPYWGYDADGNAVINKQEVLTNSVNVPLATPLNPTATYNAADVDASRIAGSLYDGTTTYHVDELELRFALKSKGDWELYVACCKKNGNHGANIGPAGLQQRIQCNSAAIQPADFRNPNAALDIEQSRAENEVYEFVHNIANSWYGKKFWAALPFILSKQDPETLVVTDSQEVCNGGYVAPGDTPLGLGANNQDIFMNEDGTVGAFARYDGIQSADLSLLNDSNVIQDNACFTKVSIDPNIYFFPEGGPAVVIDVSSPIFFRTADVVGDVDMWNAVINNLNGWTVAMKMGGFATIGDFNCCAAPPMYPSMVAIPLRSNLLTYGPWYFAGPAGPVNFEANPALVPWVYGGYDFMNQAALAKVTESVTWQQIGECGSLELAGAPLCSLGRKLQAGGPDTTNIEVTYGEQGIQTSYKFRTFTDLRLGTFTRGAAERIKKIGNTQNEIRKTIKLSVRENQLAQSLAEKTYVNHTPLGKDVLPHSPMPVVLSTYVVNPNTSNMMAASSIDEYQEGASMIRTNDNSDGAAAIYNNSSLVSLCAVMRGFTMHVDVSPNMPVPPAAQLTGAALQAGQPIMGKHLNPFTQDPTNLDFDYIHNCVGLTGPMIVTGYGWDISGNPVPANDAGNDFLANVHKRSDKWKVGPVDNLWDENRGVWTSHDIVRGTATVAIAAGSPSSPSGPYNINVLSKGGTLNPAVTLKAYNCFNATIASGKGVVLAYSVYDNAFMIIAADC